MDDNYTGNGSNNTNGLQIDRYFLDKGSVDNNLYIKVKPEIFKGYAEWIWNVITWRTILLSRTSNTSNQPRNFFSQTKYIREMLKRFRMEDCKPVTTPMKTSCKLSKHDDSKSTD